MPNDPWYFKFLDKLGVNTTQLRWKMYRMEQQAQRAREQGVTPAGLKWLTYEHKLCRHCGAVNDRASRQCHRCQRRLPGMLGYRLFRVAGLMFPDTVPVVSTVFMFVMVAIYGVMVLLDGFSAVLAPGDDILYLMGAMHQPDWVEMPSRIPLPSALALWRWMAFGLVHIGIIHIGFNVFATTQVAPLIEGQIGRNRMLVLITVCQIAAAAATYYWYVEIQPQRFTTAGASGWVFGLIGFGGAYFHRAGITPYRDVFVRWIIYALLFGIIIGANNAAHVGGMLAGAAFAYLPEARGHEQVQRSQWAWQAASAICLAVWIATGAMMIYFAFTHLGLLGKL